jgi:hypothetical protein
LLARRGNTTEIGSKNDIIEYWNIYTKKFEI